MGKFKNFAQTRVYYNDDDWEFEDEVQQLQKEEGIEEECVAASIPKEDGRLGEYDCQNVETGTTPEMQRLMSLTTKTQLSMETSTLDRKLFTSKGTNRYPTAWNHDTKIGKLRFNVHHVMDHIATRIFTLLLVILDIAITIVSFFDEANKRVYSLITLVVVVYFVIEAMLRIFAWGSEFFHHRLEVIDFTVIIVTFAVVLLVELIEYYEDKKSVKYASLVVVFRLARIFFYLRIFYGVWQSVRRAARNLVGQNKRRYVKDGYNLDLTYITDRLIAMSFPSSGLIASYRNPIREVADFFNDKHYNQYVIWNLCSERHYDTSFFHDQVERLKIDDHNVPKMSELLQFCQDADEWMKSDEKNVLAIHCKGGKGRTGTCVAAWLLFSGQIKTADKALLYFGNRRTDKAEGVSFQGVETPSQIRYVQYLESVLKNMNGKLPSEREVLLKAIKITGLKGVGNGDGSDLTMQIVVNGEVFHECPVQGEYRRNKDMLINKFMYDSTKKIKGDVKFRFISTNKDVPEDYDYCAFFFWIHTSFIINDKFYAKREEIGNCHKPKYHNIYKPNFTITLSFTEPLIEIVTPTAV